MTATTDPFTWNFDLPPAVQGENYGETFRKSLVSKSVSEKAQRLAAGSKVERVRGHVYRVQGDHDSYIVVVSFPEEVSGACNCPAKGTCSHLIAACAYDLANPVEESAKADDPFRGIL